MLDCDVLIAGGGPVGLSLAAELGMRGISVWLFDDKPGTRSHPATNANSARTMQHLRHIGVTRESRKRYR
jgi:2-polyprenyl-6-methoxyphenol hydroxylase-like FAD-dependent oxidoreductase